MSIERERDGGVNPFLPTDLVRRTRPDSGAGKHVKDHVSWGAGPRASQALILGAKARAILDGRTHVTCEDVANVVAPVLRHRILTNFTASAEGVTTDMVVERLLKETPSREGELTRDERFKKIFAS